MRRTKNTYFYMVTISVLYFVMILLLHSRLQGEICQMQIVYKNAEIHNHSNISYHHTLVRNNMLVGGFKNVRSCHLSPESRDFAFQTVANNFFFVYTAYLDTRLNTTFIRIMSILLRGNKDNVGVVCTVKKDDGGDLDIEAVRYEMCENHNKKFGGWIMSCPLPKELKEPCNVKVSIYHRTNHLFQSNNVTLKLIKISPSSANQKYTVCVPPLFGKVNFSRLIEFMEFTKYFGAEKFIFYDHAINDDKSLKALEYYTNRSLVTTIPWKLPTFLKDADIWYHGQLIAHNDCLYRSMSLTDKLAIQDIDELIVPHDGNSYWEQSLTPLFNNNVVGLGIHSAFFETNLNGDILAISSIKRTKTFSRFRTKVLVKPSAIFEVGIHHVSKPLLEKYKIISPDTKIVILHHYRRCLSNYGMNCKDWVVDKTIKIKYGHIQNQILKIKSGISRLVTSKPVNAQVVNVTLNKLLT